MCLSLFLLNEHDDDDTTFTFICHDPQDPTDGSTIRGLSGSLLFIRPPALWSQTSVAGYWSCLGTLKLIQVRSVPNVKLWSDLVTGVSGHSKQTISNPRRSRPISVYLGHRSARGDPVCTGNSPVTRGRRTTAAAAAPTDVTDDSRPVTQMTSFLTDPAADNVMEIPWMTSQATSIVGLHCVRKSGRHCSVHNLTSLNLSL